MATEALIVKLDADTDQYNRKMAKAARNTTRSTDKMAVGFKNVDTSTKKSTQTLSKFNLTTVASAVGVALLTRKIVDYSDAMTSINNKLKIATDSTEDLNKVTDPLVHDRCHWGWDRHLG